MVSCVACGCSKIPKNTKLGITFHRFPKDDVRKKAWLKVVNRTNWKPTTNSFLCSEHFSKDCFDRTSNLKIRLFVTAVPTIEVDRLKNVRSYITTCKRPFKILPEDNSTVTETPLGTSSTTVVEKYSQNIEIPGTSTDSPLLQEMFVNFENTPFKKMLERRILELQQKDIIKTHKIQIMQKTICHQKNTISSLRAELRALTEKWARR